MNSDFHELLPLLESGVKRILASCCPPLPPECTPGAGGSVHAHRGSEILAVLQGESAYFLNNRWYWLVPGDALFIAPWQNHGFYYCKGDHDLKHLWISLHPRQVNVVLTEVDSAGSVFRKLVCCESNNTTFQALVTCWDRMRTGKGTEAALDRRMLQCAAELFLCELSRIILVEAQLAAGRKSEEIINFVADYIERTHGSDCSLGKLEKLTGYSRFYLSHLYRQHYSKTIGVAVNEARMRYLLEQNWTTNAKELASMLGFSSASNLWKWRRNNRDLENHISRELNIDPATKANSL